MSEVNLTISNDIVNPIVESKIKSAIIEAMGGSDILIAKIVDQIINQKVDENGNLSNYSSSNKHKWLDVIVTKQLEKAVKDELVAQIEESSSQIKDALVAQIRTKSGANKVAKALLSGLDGAFNNTWRSNLSINFEQLKD